MSPNAASCFENSSSFFSSFFVKRVFSRRTILPPSSAATFACASAPTVSSANVTIPPRYSLSLSATILRENFCLSPCAFSMYFAVAASLSSSGRAATAAASFFESLISLSKMLWGLPIWEQRTTLQFFSTRYLIVGRASVILLSLVMTPSFTGTLKSHLTRTLLPATSISSIDFLL